MTSKIVVNNIEADVGTSAITFGSDVQLTSGSLSGISTIGITTAYIENLAAGGGGTNIEIVSGSNVVGLSTGSIYAPGTILQVVQTHSTTRTESNATVARAQISSLDRQITSTVANSKFVIIANVAFGHSKSDSTYGFAYFTLTRDGDAIGAGTSEGNRPGVMHGAAGIDNDFLLSWNGSYVDSPNQPSGTSLTYGVGYQNGYISGDTVYINRSSADTDQYYSGRGSSNILVMEVAP